MGIFRCKTCKRQYEDKTSYNNHRAIDKKKYICDVCHKVFNMKQVLRNHSLIHLTKGPYACKVCRKVFDRFSRYISHLKLHRRPLFHKCCNCKMEFTCKEQLRLHKMIHYNEMPYKCLTCSKRFIFKKILLMHCVSHVRAFGYVHRILPENIVTNEMRLAMPTSRKLFALYYSLRGIPKLVIIHHLKNNRQMLLPVYFDDLKKYARITLVKVLCEGDQFDDIKRKENQNQKESNLSNENKKILDDTRLHYTVRIVAKLRETYTASRRFCLKVENLEPHETEITYRQKVDYNKFKKLASAREDFNLNDVGFSTNIKC